MHDERKREKVVMVDEGNESGGKEEEYGRKGRKEVKGGGSNV